MLGEETTAEIMAEIKLRPDVGSEWDISDLSQMFPRLCEKYNNEPEEDSDMGFKMEY